MGVCEGGLQSSGKGLGMEGREVDRSSSSRRRFLLVGMGRGWDLFTSPGRGASGGGGVPGGVPGAKYRSSGELLR